MDCISRPISGRSPRPGTLCRLVTPSENRGTFVPAPSLSLASSTLALASARWSGSGGPEGADLKSTVSAPAPATKVTSGTDLTRRVMVLFRAAAVPSRPPSRALRCSRRTPPQRAPLGMQPSPATAAARASARGGGRTPSSRARAGIGAATRAGLGAPALPC